MFQGTLRTGEPGDGAQFPFPRQYPLGREKGTGTYQVATVGGSNGWSIMQLEHCSLGQSISVCPLSRASASGGRQSNHVIGTASMLVSPHSLASCKHPQGPCASLLWQMLSEPSYVQGTIVLHPGFSYLNLGRGFDARFLCSFGTDTA